MMNRQEAWEKLADMAGDTSIITKMPQRYQRVLPEIVMVLNPEHDLPAVVKAEPIKVEDLRPADLDELDKLIAARRTALADAESAGDKEEPMETELKAEELAPEKKLRRRRRKIKE